MFKHILLATDGSERSEKAINGGLQLAKAIGARVTGFYAKELYLLSYYDYYPSDATRVEEFEKNEERRAQKYLSAISKAAEEAGVSCEVYTTASSHPHEAILQAAADKGCDLIVMATHGRRGVSGLLLGSVTTKVLTYGKIPVLVYR